MTTRHRLLQEHEALEQRFGDLATRANEGDWEDVDEVWDGFAAQLERHLSFEEDELFDAFAKQGPQAREEVDLLRKEHAHIRRTVAELGLQIQLHAITAATIDDFVARLRNHAQREDKALYRWVDTRAAMQSEPERDSRPVPRR